jgi:kanamycin kinase
VSGGDFSHLAAQHTLGDQAVPEVVVEAAGGATIELVWRNDLGGLTFRCGDRFVKWNPRSTGIDLGRERDRLEWLSTRHPAPNVLDHGANATAQWLVTGALPGECAVGETWRARRSEALRAIADGLRALHAVPTGDFPAEWVSEGWAARRPVGLGTAPPVADVVLVHGDACAPNTLISAEGQWVGHVDLGDMTLGDRWADLAVASLSLDWNFGDGHQDEFFRAYGVQPDIERIGYYRALWQLES